MFRGMNSRRIFAVIIGLVLLSALSFTQAAGEPVPSGGMQPLAYVQLTNFNSGKCLVAQGPNDGSLAFQYDCSWYGDQWWQLEPTGDGDYWIRNENSGKCLVVQGDADGARAFQYTCLTDLKYYDQHWLKISDPYLRGRGYQLVNANSGKCLVVQGGANGAPAFQYSCLDYNDQYWQILPS